MCQPPTARTNSARSSRFDIPYFQKSPAASHRRSKLVDTICHPKQIVRCSLAIAPPLTRVDLLSRHRRVVALKLQTGSKPHRERTPAKRSPLFRSFRQDSCRHSSHRIPSAATHGFQTSSIDRLLATRDHRPNQCRRRSAADRSSLLRRHAVASMPDRESAHQAVRYHLSFGHSDTATEEATKGHPRTVSERLYQPVGATSVGHPPRGTVATLLVESAHGISSVRHE